MQTKATTSTHLIFKSLSRHFLGTLWIWTKSKLFFFFQFRTGIVREGITASNSGQVKIFWYVWQFVCLAHHSYPRFENFQIFYQVLLIILIRNQLINLGLLYFFQFLKNRSISAYIYWTLYTVQSVSSFEEKFGWLSNAYNVILLDSYTYTIW